MMQVKLQKAEQICRAFMLYASALALFFHPATVLPSLHGAAASAIPASRKKTWGCSVLELCADYVATSSSTSLFPLGSATKI